MNNTLLHVIEQGRLWDFHGGIHPQENKSQSNHAPIERFNAGKQVIIPLKQHIGRSGDLLVEIGSKVKIGQPLTRYTSGWMLPVHAPVSGTVVAIEPRTIAHPSGLAEPCVVIENDFEDQWTALHPCHNYAQVERTMLIDRIRKAGVSGMGGAGFPTARKIESGMAKTKALIINAAECEPYITADDRLMREHAKEIVQGIDIVKHILEPQMVIIGIEDNKPEAIAALQQAAKDTDFIIRVVPTKYPSGGEKQLIEILTGMQVPTKGIPADIGIVMHNVGSMFAIKQAVVDGIPLIQRVVTITGGAFPKPQNYWVPIGTPIRELTERLNYQAAPNQKLILGGPMMGFTLPHVDVPVSKSTNCILGPTVKEFAQQQRELACIRCGQCAEVCPSRLLPQELQWHAKDGNLSKCEELNIQDCIECGACAFVCPSNIPLVHYYRKAKSEIKVQQIEVESAERAKQRFEDRKARLERDKLERELKHQKAAEARKKAASAATESGESDAVAAAIARVKQKQQGADTGKKPAVAAAIARAKAKQAAAAGNAEPDNSEMRKLREQRKQEARDKKAQQTDSATETPKTDAPKDAVAAAVARAKARKAAQKEEQASADKPKNPAVAAAVARAKAKKEAAKANSESSEAPDTPTDSKSDAVAAAVARAKARKAAQKSEQQAEHNDASADAQSISQGAGETKTDKKAAVAAAVARAKARKAAQKAEQSDAPQNAEAPTTSDNEGNSDKKAAVAAVARAKARKAAQQVEQNGASQNAEAQTPSDNEGNSDKKAAVAAAVARAKARKAARQAEKADTANTEDAEAVQAADEITDKQQAKKDAVAAAVARAKARKLAKKNEDNS